MRLARVSQVLCEGQYQLVWRSVSGCSKLCQRDHICHARDLLRCVVDRYKEAWGQAACLGQGMSASLLQLLFVLQHCVKCCPQHRVGGCFPRQQDILLLVQVFCNLSKGICRSLTYTAIRILHRVVCCHYRLYAETSLLLRQEQPSAAKSCLHAQLQVTNDLSKKRLLQVLGLHRA